jgi:hypothetical protein
LPSIGFGTTGLTSASTVNAIFQSSDGVTPAYQLSKGVPHFSPNVGPNGQPLIPTSLTSPSSSVVQLPQHAVLPCLQEWQLGIQQDLGHDWIAEIDYEGNHRVHQPVSLPINQIVPTAGCCLGLKSAQTLRPYPQFLTISALTNGGASAYAALLASLRRNSPACMLQHAGRQCVVGASPRLPSNFINSIQRAPGNRRSCESHGRS